MPTSEELIAHGRSIDTICEMIGADGLVYQDIADLIEAARRGNAAIDGFEQSIFSGDYVTGDVNEGYLKKISEPLIKSDNGEKKHP